MKTRDRILETSLRLFNEAGVAKVSTNRIATEAEISFGNLYYHFKNKGQIVEWLFRHFLFRDLDFLMREYPAVAARARKLTLRSLRGARRQCDELANAGVLRASDEDLEMLALHIVFTGTCWLSFANVLPDNASGQPPSALAAYHMLSLLAPYLAEEPRQYLNYLRSKYLK
jgi:AcrR family transcriptional regulator